MVYAGFSEVGELALHACGLRFSLSWYVREDGGGEGGGSCAPLDGSVLHSC